MGYFSLFAPSTGYDSAMLHAGPVVRTVAAKLNDFRTVKDFGAVGDGIVDDSAAINLALQTAENGMVTLPPGIYRCLSPLISPTGKKVSLVGSSRDGTILVFPNGGMKGIQFGSGCRYAHFTLRGPGAGAFDAGCPGGFDAGACEEVLFDDLCVEDWPNHGINTGGTAVRITVRKCVIRNNYNDGILLAQGALYCTITENDVYLNGANGIDLGGASRCTVSKNVVLQNGRVGSGDAWGILLAGIASGTPADASFNSIVNNICDGNIGGNLVVRAEAGTQADYNTIGSNTCINSPDGDGITIDGSSAGGMRGNILTANICCLNGRHGLCVDGQTGTVELTIVQSNITNDNDAYGIVNSAIDTQFGPNVSIGNTTGEVLDGGTRTTRIGIKDTVAHGLYVMGSSCAVAGANFLQLGDLAGSSGALRMGALKDMTFLGTGGVTKFGMGLDGSDQMRIGGGGGTLSLVLQNSAGATIATGREDLSFYFAARSVFKQLLFTQGDTTPSVGLSNVCRTANFSGGVSITRFDDGAEGQLMVLIFGDNNTTLVHSSAIQLRAGTNLLPTQAANCLFICLDGANWQQV